MPSNETNTYSSLTAADTTSCMVPPSEDQVVDVLNHLRESSATGPDLLPARVLKQCADQLKAPICRLAMRILHSAHWPEDWLVHWIVPIYKKAAVYMAENYRGVHLRAQLSKAMERILGGNFMLHMSTGAYGPNQFAY